MGYTRLTDDEIQAFIDEEYPPEQMQGILTIILSSPEYTERYLELRRQKDMLVDWWKKYGREH